MIRLTRVMLCTVSALEKVSGTSFRAAAVSISKFGIRVTKRNAGGTFRRTQRASRPIMVEAVNAPNVAGAALSGCPSSSVTSSNNCCRDKAAPLSSFNAAITPRRTVTLDPRPRAIGTSPERYTSKPNAFARALRKNRREASAISFVAPGRASSGIGETMSGPFPSATVTRTLL